jgi:hypothetical protein
MLSTDLEQLLSDKSKLEHDISVAVNELTNSRALNDAAHLDNVAKDNKLIELDHILIELQRELPLEIAMEHLERESFENTHEYDMETEQMTNSMLALNVQRYKVVEEEITKLRATAIRLEHALHEASSTHVESMHTLNKELLTKSKAFEDSFKLAVNRAMVSHAEKALTELSAESQKVLHERELLLREMDVQKAGLDCLKSKIKQHETACATALTKCQAYAAEADCLRAEILALKGGHPLQVSASLDSSFPRKETNLKSRASSVAFSKSSSSLPVITAAISVKSNQAADFHTTLANDPTYVCLRHKLNVLLSLQDDVAFERKNGRKASKGPRLHASETVCFNEFKRLLEEDEEFRVTVDPLLGHLSAIMIADESTDASSNIIGWLAVQVTNHRMHVLYINLILL